MTAQAKATNATLTKPKPTKGYMTSLRQVFREQKTKLMSKYSKQVTAEALADRVSRHRIHLTRLKSEFEKMRYSLNFEAHQTMINVRFSGG
ncbi:hypothetical protein [Holzapfeliella floricola]|uniref:Uncharacterized protein n=1 Tax=Holzapfeliella floricola DSM 23037 = JCM 16512 TaxID=1423744 RepID=A0A0R2DU06_9LACO|nr:hypothetical protein [Holzapfeliella floricola]KRN03996.1 hypothetical protein FC86_GL000524 [Holzapfeliella floricola DSM 23037 = JCM 16512]